MTSSQPSNTSHSSLLLGLIPKLNESTRVDWTLGIKTYLKGRKLWKHIKRDTSLSDEDKLDFDKVEQLEAERATVLEVIRATVAPTRLPAIRGIENPKKAYELLIEQASQDDGLEVAALIARVATIRYSRSEPITSFLDTVNNLHTKLADATAEDDDLKISDKLLAVFLLLSFPSDQFSTIRDQMFGELKTLSTSKVTSRLRTKSALSSVDEVPIAMATSAKASTTASRMIEPRTDRSPNALCVLEEHWMWNHTNGVCSKQRRPGSSKPTPQANLSNSSNHQLSDEEKIKRYNRLAAAGVIG